MALYHKWDVKNGFTYLCAPICLTYFWRSRWCAVIGNFIKKNLSTFDTFVSGIWIGFKLIWMTEKIFGRLLYILEMLSTSRNLDLLERNLWSICGIGPAHIWCTILRFSKPMYNVEWVLKISRLIHMCVLLVRKICF